MSSQFFSLCDTSSFLKMNKCKKLDNFCYVCGHYTVNKNKRKITSCVSKSYEASFKINIVIDWFTPSFICTTCFSKFSKWDSCGAIFNFSVPMLWFPSNEHTSSTCYGCINVLPKATKTQRFLMKYKASTNVQLPIPHSLEVSIPENPNLQNLQIQENVNDLSPSYTPSECTLECNHTEYSQIGLDILVRQLKLSQRQSILLTRSLKRRNLVKEDVKVYNAKKRSYRFSQFFSSIENNTLAYCVDVKALIIEMQNEYQSEEWRLFIDSSKSSLKAVLLHNTNKRPSVPIALSTNTKESYASIKKILELVQYDLHKWKICCDLKVVAILCGLQAGYTKNMCYLCLWDTRYSGNQYEKNDWPKRTEFQTMQNNLINKPLIPIEKILLPPLHIKLGIVKNFIKSLDKNGPAFLELQKNFPRLSTMKIKEGILLYLFNQIVCFINKIVGILNGPDIRRLTRSELFEDALNATEQKAWKNVKDLIKNVLGNSRASNWKEIVQNTICSFKPLEVRMSLKVHFLHCHADKFAEQTPLESDEHGERFHQITARLENWYSGKKLDSLLGDICWNLIEEYDSN